MNALEKPTQPAHALTASPRLAIYGVGFIGKAVTRLALEKGWRVVAAYNRAGDKVGQDLGRLAGLDRDLGVVVQDDQSADYGSLEADIAMVCGPDDLISGYPIYEKFLGAGINVFSYGTDAYEPNLWHPELAAKIDRLAKEKGVTFTGGGIWDSTRIWPGLVAVGPCIEITSLEYLTSINPVPQGVHWFPHVGIGMTVEEYKKAFKPENVGLNGTYRTLLGIVLKYCGFTPINKAQAYREPVVLDEAVYCKEADRLFEAGVCVGTRTRVKVDSEEGVPATAVIEARLMQPGEIEEGGWIVNGLPGAEVRVVRKDTGLTSATSGLHRVPDVLAAPPGIVSISSLGPLKPAAVLR